MLPWHLFQYVSYISDSHTCMSIRCACMAEMVKQKRHHFTIYPHYQPCLQGQEEVLSQKYVCNVYIPVSSCKERSSDTTDPLFYYEYYSTLAYSSLCGKGTSIPGSYGRSQCRVSSASLLHLFATCNPKHVASSENV